MGTNFKVFFTVAAFLAALAISVVSKADDTQTEWLWRYGKDDPLRRLIATPNGKLRRYTKHGIMISFTLLVIFIWTVA